MTGNIATRSMLAAEPREMVRTLRALIAATEEDLARMRRELQQWLEADGRRPGDGSDQPSLFGNVARQPKLW